MFKLARHEMHVNYQARYSTMRYSDSLRLQIQKYLSMSIMDIYYMCACVSQHKRHQIGDGDHYCPLHHQDHIHLYSALSWHIKKKKSSVTGISLCQVETRLFFLIYFRPIPFVGKVPVYLHMTFLHA